MAIRIVPADGVRLALSGDVETELHLSARACGEGFVLAFSDGTLVRGEVDSVFGEVRFALAVEGAGRVSIGRAKGGDVLDLSWRIEWITLAAGSDALCPDDADHAFEQRELALAGAQIAG